MSWKPRQHFDEDLGRARAMLVAAKSIPSGPAEDVRRSAVVLAVGALDAYLCDAYLELLVVAMKSATAGQGPLRSGFAKVELPIGELMGKSYERPTVALRNAAKKKMEKDNLLQVGRVKEMFNPALPNGQKLWDDIITKYTDLGVTRITGPTTTAAIAKASDGAERKRLVNKAIHAKMTRMGTIIQRRHDIVHNCDRPKHGIRAMNVQTAKLMVDDVARWVEVLDDHIVVNRVP